jgi:hypothetical protein
MENVKDSNNTQSKDDKEKLKLINRSRIAEIRRQLKGAEKRTERLELELSEIRSILKRGYIEKTNKKGVVTQIPLKPFERDTYRNKRVIIEQQLALAKRDYLVSNRVYKQAINNNFRANKLKLNAAKKDNGIRRNTKKLFEQTLELVKQQATNGGESKFRVLQSLAEIGDVKGFRKAFDEIGPELNKELHITVSGVSEVKTEILHGLMDELASKGSNPSDVTDLKTK